MEELTRQGGIGRAAVRAGMDRKTARKYVCAGKLPSEIREARDWTTRTDPFAEDWPAVAALLRETPELEAKTLFDQLTSRHPGRYEPGQLRTLQRREEPFDTDLVAAPERSRERRESGEQSRLTRMRCSPATSSGV